MNHYDYGWNYDCDYDCVDDWGSEFWLRWLEVVGCTIAVEKDMNKMTVPSHNHFDHFGERWSS